jgi:hypothetical protein
MSEQIPKLTTREQLEAELAITRNKLAQSEHEIERSRGKLEEANKRLVEAREEFNTHISNFIDINKISFEAMKHLTTLSAGSIILMVTFIEKLFTANREWTSLIGTTLICFVISIVCAVSSMTKWGISMMFLITGNFADSKARAHRQLRIERTAYLMFLLGIISFVIFALKNLY